MRTQNRALRLERPLAHPQNRIPHTLQRWILTPGSLTAHLSSACKTFSVQVLYQGTTWSWPHEAKILKLPPHTLVQGRIVLLCCDGQPFVLARTILSSQALKHTWKPLSTLGKRPLAELLFSNPYIQRSPLSIYRLHSKNSITRWVHHIWNTTTHRPWANRTVWARQSCFRLNGIPMLVTEYFAPCLKNLDFP